MLENFPHQIVKDLYRCARETPGPHFQEKALILVKRALPFDSAMWNIARLVNGEPRPLQLYLYNRPKEMITRDYEQVKHQDLFMRRNLGELGITHTISTEELPETGTDALWRWIKEYDLERALATLDLDRTTRLLQGIVLWRGNNNHPFDDRDQCFKQDMMEHLVESYKQHIEFEAHRQILQIWEEPPAVAKADAKGFLHESGERFIGLLLTEWPTWQNARLPQTLVERLTQNSEGIYLGKKIAIRCQRKGDLYLLVGRRLGLLAALSERERAIALMFADGLKPREIAAWCHIEYVTVRNHLGNVYRKLNVHDKNELAKCLTELLRLFGSMKPW